LTIEVQWYKEKVMNNSGRIGSVDKALILMNHILKEGGITVQKAARMLDVNRSSAYRLLETLAVHDYAAKDTNSTSYVPGYRLAFYHAARPDSSMVYQACREVMVDFMQTTGLTVHLCELRMGMMRFIGYEYGKEAVRIVMNDEQMYCTASGKAVLAFLPEIYRQELISNMVFQPFTPATIRDAEALAVELDAVRKAGYARDDCELHPSVYCVAAPVFSGPGGNIYSLGISSMHRVDDGCAQALVKSAEKASVCLENLFGLEGKCI
jgi:DNA-binding IclR family transcriptional regulator